MNEMFNFRNLAVLIIVIILLAFILFVTISDVGRGWIKLVFGE